MADDVVWMPFYVGDYLADTTNLSTEQHGAYLLLLFAAWKAGGYLPNDDRQLANIVRFSHTKWKNSKDLILSFFEHSERGFTQSRLLEEYSKTLRFLESKRENGKKGGRPKKEKQPEIEKPIGLANQKLEETQSQSHTQRDKDQDQKTLAVSDKSPPAGGKPKVGFDYDTGRFENLTTELITAWANAYPAVDIRQEIAKAKAWLLANPKNRKSAISKFLNNWLSRAQDNAPRIGIHATHQRPGKQTPADRIRAQAAAIIGAGQADEHGETGGRLVGADG